MSLPATTAQDATRTGIAPTVAAAPRAGLYASEHAFLGWIALVALFHGLLFVVIVPPWQHYDEPAHFLYAAEIMVGEQTTPGPASERLRREIADSMYRFRFFEPGTSPDILAPTPPEVGISQRVHPPLYYELVAMVLRPFAELSVEAQLYIARLVSLGFYLLTVLATWRVAVTLAPAEPLVARVVPLLMVLMPTFADIMAAVNNDVLLNFSLMVALLGAVLAVRDGPRPYALALLFLGASVAFLTKRTSLVALPPLLLALVWTVWRRPIRWWILPLAVAALALGLGLVTLEPVQMSGPQGPYTVLGLHPWLARLGQGYLRTTLDGLVRSLSDPNLIGDRYWTLLDVGFSSYYTHFGWGNLTLHVGWTLVFALLHLVALAGLGYGALRLGPALSLWQQRSLWLFVVSVVVAWASLFIRLHPLPPLDQTIYIPRARYMFWALVPTLWLLVLGLNWATPVRWRRVALLGLIGFFLCFNLAAWMWILRSYYN